MSQRYFAGLLCVVRVWVEVVHQGKEFNKSCRKRSGSAISERRPGRETSSQVSVTEQSCISWVYADFSKIHFDFEYNLWIVKEPFHLFILITGHDEIDQMCLYTDLQHQRTRTRTRRAWAHPGRPWARALRPHRWACRCDGHILPARRTSPPLCCWWVLSIRPKRRWQEEKGCKINCWSFSLQTVKRFIIGF